MNAEQIRQYVDGELGPEERAEFEAALAESEELQAQVRFEGQLRDRVAGRMVAASRHAPDDLRESIESAIRQEAKALDKAANKSGGGEKAVVGAIRPSSRISYFAVAACLALVAGAVLFGIFGKPLFTQSLTANQVDLQELSRTTAVAEKRHFQCKIGSSEHESYHMVTDASEIHATLDPHLGATVPLVNLTALGYTFDGAGPCILPPSGTTTCHLVYQSTRSNSLVSLFVQVDGGQFGMLDRDRLYTNADTTITGTPSSAPQPSGAWSDGNLIYIVVADSAEEVATIANVIRQSLAE